MWSGRRTARAWIVAGGLVVVMLAGAPVFASGDDHPPVAPTLCPPGDESAGQSLAPPSPSLDASAETSTPAPVVPPCLPPCDDDYPRAEDLGSGDPAAATTATAPTTIPASAESASTAVPPPCLPLCDADDESDADDPAASTAVAPAMICIPTAELETAIDDSIEPAVVETDSIAPPADPSLPVEPIEPELEAPAIPEVPKDGWPIRPIAFPVHGPVRYDDDWGNCRGGPACPRHHIGNDIVGVRLQPLVAAADGVVTHLVQNHPTAGWGFVITDDEGWDYRYYHVNNDTPGTDDGQDDGTWRLIDGLAVGSEVLAGQVVGFMGDSGNSEHSVPHLHFEIHQPDGVAINPFRSLHLAEWVARCSGASDPYRDVIVPVPFPLTATQPVEIDFGEGEFLIGNDGSWAAIGDARQSGDSRHVDGTPACPPPG